MKKTKKIVKGLAVSALALIVGVLPVSGCSKKDKIVRDEKTINIRALIGGYGDSWLKALANKFNEVYAEEGYKANVLASSYDLDSKVAMKELYSRDDWVDLYFVTVNNTMSDFTASGGEYGQLVADLTDKVWNNTPINFKGEEESKTIAQKMQVPLPDDVLKVNDKVYGFNISNDIGGMIVNTEKLAKYGVTEIPKTTKELFDVFELIYLGDEDKGIEGSMESNIYPVTFLGGDNGYPIHFVTAWQAQYAGIEEYNRFYGYTDEKGNERTEDGYKVYDSESLNYMLEAMYQMYDSSFVALGSSNNTIDTAHTKIMSEKGGAVFMSDGNWAYNEIVTNYSKEIGKLAFANVPVLSAVGVKLFAKHGLTDAQCEEALSWIIDKADAGKTADEITTLIKTEKTYFAEVANEQLKKDVEEVMKARGIYCSRSSLAAGAFVAEKSQAKEVCYLFLRMFASDDNATLYNQECNGFTAYMSDFSQAKNMEYNKQCQAILENPYAMPVWMNATDLRLKLGHNNLIFPNSDLSFVSKIIEKRASKYADGKKKTDAGIDNLYKNNAEEMLKDVRAHAAENWEEWIGKLGK